MKLKDELEKSHTLAITFKDSNQEVFAEVVQTYKRKGASLKAKYIVDEEKTVVPSTISWEDLQEAYDNGRIRVLKDPLKRLLWNRKNSEEVYS